jgi:DNA-binding beta-propeller fold protein YncE
MNPFEEELSMKKACQLVCVVAALIAALCLMVAAPAGAVYTHVLTKSIGEAGSGDGQVALVSGNASQSGSSGVTVNEVTHDVYVADTGNHRIDEFSAAGAFIRAWGWGVADGKTEALQTCASGCHAGLEGAGPGELTDPTFIAVDNSDSPSKGDVYVANKTLAGYKEGVTEVEKFTATGGYLSRNDGSEALLPIPGPFGALIGGIAVDTAGNLWVDAEDPGGFNDPRGAAF